MTVYHAIAKPTKKLFIDTLVRDVDLISAIVDLVDNSVDGARRIRPNENFKGLAIEIEVGAKRFLLKDNCGGIPLEIAQNYAFRFGRSSDQPAAVAHSVGHFGVGMKRTLFKIAKKFTITSMTDKDEFGLGVDVDQWEMLEDDWSFPMVNVNKYPKSIDRVTGTVILVDSLRDDVAEEFGLNSFRGLLRERIRLAHTKAISDGLEINFNGDPLEAEVNLTIKSSAHIKPGVKTGTFTFKDGTVEYSLISGVDDRDSQAAGWYVFCNGRLLLNADQTQQTGWGQHPAPAFHQQFNHFRGYLYLESDNPGLLPWNTTKTGMSEDHDVFRRVRLMMAEATAEVTAFLNKVRIEEAVAKQDEGAAQPLHEALDKCKKIDVPSQYKSLQATAKFTWPTVAAGQKQKSQTTRIAYTVDRERAEAMKKALGVTSNSAIGLETFEYYYSLHLEDE
ncbi:ATP-binding protein [Xanthomonas campestris pv. campestris]|uniref:ATP-binding protein n=1 Tax=Xanthomonas campestris TaxID=339 RepID=UPI00226A0B20|nr:ATP-binding protein [Xanthomonas campestris]MEB1349638.1 ATP-binding protein [Xanthomonas campestris pv. campestris]WDK49092.1 ATP-binding protein [Xanthomonas campestris pv. campestris]WDK54656.1 ATP-binding protein [Xanthomonas campestris pv. campestris]WDL63489.1 ATP-binding protein [Xanthomonas campestris pv. campestris]WDL67557.1 ATP-binding protein [Xanthomonas campestris pv. campestris]